MSDQFVMCARSIKNGHFTPERPRINSPYVARSNIHGTLATSCSLAIYLRRCAVTSTEPLSRLDPSAQMADSS